MAVGAGILAVGLVLPFLVADPVSERALVEQTDDTTAGGFDPADLTDDIASSTTTTLAAAVSGAGGAEGGPGSSSSGGAGGSAGVARTASDVGITADVITVGVPVPDASAMGDTEGGAKFGETIGDFRKQYQAAIDAVNAAGGINGRQVKAEYRSYAAGDPDQMRAACVYLTEQKKVFAILGGFYGDPILCITEQHKTPLVAQASEPDDYYARSNGLYFSITPTKDRLLANQVAALHRDGDLARKTIGVLDQEGVDAIPVDRTLFPALKARGYKVAYHARIANDVGAAQSQIPIEVQRMRDAGVDTIIVASGLIRATVFVQEAENQRYLPRYLLSDFASGATDIYTIAMPDAFANSIGYTAFRTGEARAGLPEAAHDKACRENYQQRTNDQVSRTGTEYFYVVAACGITGLFERGMAAAGANPTRASFSQAMQHLGRVQVPFGDVGSFGPGKYDAPDTARRVVWKLDCRCWMPAGPFKATG